MHLVRIAAVALVLGAAASAPAFGIASVTVFGLRAPEEVAGFTLNDSTNLERGKPGEGYGLEYSQSGWKLDVFIYDLKRIAIPDDARSAIVKAEFERSRADVFLAQPRGLYTQVYLRRNFTIDDAAKRTRFQCAAFQLIREGAKPQDGYLCVTSWSNKFVKFRLTTLSGSDTEALARKYVAAWIPVLFAPGAHVEPRRAVKSQGIHRRAPRRPPPRRPVCPPGYICR